MILEFGTSRILLALFISQPTNFAVTVRVSFAMEQVKKNPDVPSWLSSYMSTSCSHLFCSTLITKLISNLETLGSTCITLNSDSCLDIFAPNLEKLS